MKEYDILVCDESVFVRNILADILERNACGRVLHATNGREGVEIYKEYKPRIVFMDILMPVMNGLEAVVEIRAFDPDARIVMVSAMGTKDNIRISLEEGAVDFIQKPIAEEAILKAIARIEAGWEET